MDWERACGRRARFSGLVLEAAATAELPRDADKHLRPALKKHLRRLRLPLDIGSTKLASPRQWIAWMASGDPEVPHGAYKALVTREGRPSNPTWSFRVTYSPQRYRVYEIARGEGRTVNLALNRARLKTDPRSLHPVPRNLRAGERVEGVYLGKRFRGRVSPSAAAGGIVVDLDRP
ncbi:MAG: hypothetical protein D6724_08845, partial [Armatimonadetes bacterium]